MARYSSPPPRVAAFRRSSREIVDGDRPRRPAISRIPKPCAFSSASSSRSANDRYRPVSGDRSIVGMPPPCRNHLVPAAGDTPTTAAASSGSSPLATSRQNSRSTSRRNDGAPGDFIDERPVNAIIQPAGRPIPTSAIEVLRRPVEFAIASAIRVEDRLVGENMVPGGHVYGPLDERRLVVIIHRPAHDSLRVTVDHGRQIY